jgi:hypothetical protein
MAVVGRILVVFGIGAGLALGYLCLSAFPSERVLTVGFSGAVAALVTAFVGLMLVYRS